MAVVIRRLGALVGLIALTGLVLDRIYAGRLCAALVTGAGALAALISVLLRRRPAGWVAPLSLTALGAVLLGATVWTAHAADVAGSPPRLLADALAHGIPRLLTAMIPVEPQPDSVLLPMIAAWLAALVGAEVMLRSPHVLLAFGPPTLLFGAALLLVGPNAGPQWAIDAAFVGLIAAGTVRTSAGPGWRRVLGGLAAVGSITALTAAMAPPVFSATTTAPTDPRRYVTPPVLDTLDENPLIRLSGWALRPAQRLFDARMVGAVRGEQRLRLAVLTEYDGVTWHAGATYRSAGRQLPALADESPEPASTLRQQITIGGLSGRLLPAAATPRRVDGVRVAFDQRTGALMRPTPLSDGVRYTVDSAVRPVAVNALPAADVPQVAGLVTVGDEVPAAITTLAQQLGEQSVSPYERAAAIEDYLREHYRLVADAPSGHAYPNLGFFLFGPVRAGGQRGTSEQFAASFAVLARLLGLPTRVVVGFRLPAGGGTVHGRDALAWPEVLFAGVGWVAFDPLPRPRQRPQPLEQPERPRPDRSTPPPTPAPTPSAPAPSASATAAATVAQAPTSRPLQIGALLTGIAALLLVGLVLARQRLTRRRLVGGDPTTRIDGAWAELVDALRLAGRPAPAHLTAAAVATHAAAEELLAPLVVAVNQSSFAPRPATAATATAATTAARAYVRELRANQQWWRRMVWSLHPGPLRWRSGRSGQHSTGSDTVTVVPRPTVESTET